MMVHHAKNPVERFCAFLFYVLIFTGWVLVGLACLVGLPAMLIFPGSEPLFAALFFGGCLVGISAEIFRPFTDQ